MLPVLPRARRACASHPRYWHRPFSDLCVVLSLCLHSVGGLILDKTVSDPNFAGMAVFTPVINGEVLASAARGKGEGRKRGFGELCISQGYSRQENLAQLVQD